MPTTYPIVPWHEFVGEVSEVGSAVTTLKKSDKVGFWTKKACCGTCSVCLSGDDELFSEVKVDLTYGKYFGGYATQVQQSYDFFFKLPDNFKMNLGAPLFCAGITNYILFIGQNKFGSLVGPRGAIKQMVEFCSDKDIFPSCEEYDFEDLPRAFNKLENGKPYFRCVLNAKDFAVKNGWKK